jgi:hypothetical protein
VSLDPVIDSLNRFFDTYGAPLIVVLFFWFRFHTLKGTRSFTTRPLFALGVAIFISPFVALYWALVHWLWPMAAIWLVMLAWTIPLAPSLWRRACQQLAGIPDTALGLRDALAAAPFEVHPDDMPSLKRKLARVGYQVDDFRAVQSTAIQSRLLKISALMLHLERWAGQGEGFITRNPDVYAELLSAYDALCFRTVRVLRSSADVYGAIMADSRVEPNDWEALDSLSSRHSSVSQLQLAAQTAAGEMLEDLRKDMDSLLNNLLLFAVRAALAGEWTLFRSRQRLGAIGFTLQPASPGLLRFIAVVAAFGFGWALLWLLLSGGLVHQAGDPSVANLRALVMTTLYLVVNFPLVYHFKQRYAFANENIFGRLPIGFILTIGLPATVIIFLPVQVVLDVWQFPDGPFPQVVLRDLPLLIFPWGIGTMTALLVQDSTWGRRSRRTRQLRDGLVFAGGMLVMLAIAMVIHQFVPMPAMSLVDGMSAWAFFKAMVAPCFLFGFIIGYLMIGRLREAAARCPVWKPDLATPSLASA